MKCRRRRCRVMVFGAGDDFCHSLHGCPRFGAFSVHADCNEKFMRLSVRLSSAVRNSTFMISIGSFTLSMTGSTRGRTNRTTATRTCGYQVNGKQALCSQYIPRKCTTLMSLDRSIGPCGFAARKNSDFVIDKWNMQEVGNEAPLVNVTLVLPFPLPRQ